MKILALIQDSQTGFTLEISELITKVTYTTTLQGQPGKVVLNCIAARNTSFSMGSLLYLTVDDVKWFFGILFNEKESQANNTIELVFYDQLRYLSNVETYDIKDLTTSQVFSKVCSDFSLKHEVITPSNYTVLPYIKEHKSLYDTIQHAIDEELRVRGNKHLIRDNFGVLEFVNILSLRTPYVLGEDTILTDFELTKSIENSYNEVKLVHEDKQTKKRTAWVDFNAENIAKWGRLRFFENIKADVNEGQLADKAKNLLKYHNRVFNTFTLKGIDTHQTQNMKAGDGFLFIGKLNSQREINSFVYIKTCTHTITGNSSEFTMEVAYDE